MIHDPCIVPQLRNKKRERDDWFLVRMGCFNGDGDTDDADSALGFEDDEAADEADRAAARAAEAEGDPRGFDDDEFEDELERRRASRTPGAVGDSDSTQFSGGDDKVFSETILGGGLEEEPSAADIFNQITGGRQLGRTSPNLSAAPSPQMAPGAGNQTSADEFFDLTQGNVDVTQISPQATPASQIVQSVRDKVNTAQSMAGVNQSRPITDFDGVTLPEGPGVPKDTFVQDKTPRTKEEEEMAADQAYFNERDLNKDGVVGPIEGLISQQAFGLVGKASDLERKASIGDKTAGLDYEGEAFGTPDSIFGGDDDTRGDNFPQVPDVPPGPAGCPDGYEFNAETGSCEYKGVSYAGIGEASPVPGAINLGPYTASTQYTGIAALEPFVLRPSPRTPIDFTPEYRFPDTSS